MLAAVEFHTGLSDAVGFACRLLRKAVRQGARIAVVGSPGALDELDRRLWTFDERDFVAHARVPPAAPRVCDRSPVWLVEGEWPEHAPTVVVNLGADWPAPAPRISRLIEIVSDDPDDAQRGRQRWRAYREQGLELVHHTARGAASA